MKNVIIILAISLATFTVMPEQSYAEDMDYLKSIVNQENYVMNVFAKMTKYMDYAKAIMNQENYIMNIITKTTNDMDYTNNILNQEN